MPIVMISESLLQRATALDGRILRDRVLRRWRRPRINPAMAEMKLTLFHVHPQVLLPYIKGYC